MARTATTSDRDVEVGGHTIHLTNLDKVLYPESGTTKREVVQYYRDVSQYLVAYAAGRPATRKRWVHGVGTADEPGEFFFQKNLDRSTPEWVRRGVQHHRERDISYPLVDDEATLVWLAQTATLEIHVPQWRFADADRDIPDRPGNPDRMVFDLDPGEGAGLPECVEVATALRDRFAEHRTDLVPVTSGSKGIHLYAPLDGTLTSDEINERAHAIAKQMETEHPDLVVSTIGKAERRGKVLLDWSQNNAAKTTVAPYSLRGRAHPTVAMPRTWPELLHHPLRQVEFHEVLAILQRRGDAAEGLRPRR